MCLCLLSYVSRARFWGSAKSRAESLRRLAAQLSTPATLLEPPPEPVVPIPATGAAPRLAHLCPRSRSRSPLPKAAPSLERRRRSHPRYHTSKLTQSLAVGSTGLTTRSMPRPPGHGIGTKGDNETLHAYHVLRPLLPPRPLLGRQVRGVAPRSTETQEGQASPPSSTRYQAFNVA